MTRQEPKTTVGVQRLKQLIEMVSLDGYHDSITMFREDGSIIFSATNRGNTIISRLEFGIPSMYRDQPAGMDPNYLLSALSHQGEKVEFLIDENRMRVGTISLPLYETRMDDAVLNDALSRFDDEGRLISKEGDSLGFRSDFTLNNADEKLKSFRRLLEIPFDVEMHRPGILVTSQNGLSLRFGVPGKKSMHKMLGTELIEVFSTLSGQAVTAWTSQDAPVCFIMGSSQNERIDWTLSHVVGTMEVA